MEFKVAAKAAAASLAPAPANQGAQGRSRVSFVSGPAPTRTKALRATSNSATPVAKYVLIGLLLARNRWVSRTSAALGSVWGFVGMCLLVWGLTVVRWFPVMILESGLDVNWESCWSSVSVSEIGASESDRTGFMA